MKKNIFAAILLFLTTLQAFGQKNADFPSFEKFYASVMSTLSYPQILQDNCASTLTLIKVIFDSSGEIQSLSFSDSAHPKFVEHMQTIKNELDFKSIYIDLKKIGHSTKPVLIPFCIDFEKIGECRSRISSYDLLNLFLFSGKQFSGEYFLYPNIYFRYVVGRTHEEHF
ncbi:hypothetical protein [Sphingobacterium sp. BIGb0165]|uniref:hypothetical protein n=1 Tax=Sphingobacterium TaxID=28453 RepID=UPI002166D20B|nr:hypothetical protein [Sphingobacterium sp. BIGb0165]MCS4224677.1 hypothetical protein [Sphingobacterium sp. BIGb0165]